MDFILPQNMTKYLLDSHKVDHNKKTFIFYAIVV